MWRRVRRVRELIMQIRDRVGLGWRPELAAGIFASLDRIDVVEVIADDYFHASRSKVRALQTLASQVPVVLHGVGLGLASAVPVEGKRLEKLARLAEQVRPEFWSEHLAFVRGGGVEIGHLAAPPRTTATIDGAAENLRRARAMVGTAPQVENIATLVEPPGSRMGEAAWIREILEAEGCDLLLDLNNVFANGSNHGYAPKDFLRQIPSARIGSLHIAGGAWIPAPGGGSRLLDDHRHDVPQEVYELLEEVASVARQPLTVILERDGDYPPIGHLLAQLERARQALQQGRARCAVLAKVCA